jgi:predicted small secreted protein
MGRYSRFRTVLTCIAAIALIAAGAASAKWPKIVHNAADQAFAKKSVLQLADFPAGSHWKAASTKGGSGTTNTSDCTGPAFSDRGRVLTGSADAAFGTTGIEIWSHAEVVQTDAMARHDVAESKNPAVRQCLSSLLKNNMPTEGKFVSIKPLPFPRIGDSTVAYRALIDVTVTGQVLRMQFDLVFVLHSRAEITLIQMAPFVISSDAKAFEVVMASRLAGAPLVA